MSLLITRKQAMAATGVTPAAWRRARIQGVLEPALTKLYKRSPYFVTDQVSKAFGVNVKVLTGSR